MNKEFFIGWLLCATAFAVFALVPGGTVMLAFKCIVAGLLVALGVRGGRL